MSEDTRTYELADVGTRVIALIIDSLILATLGGIIGAGSGFLLGGGFMGFLLGVAYQWYFLTQQNGQTLGKTIMNIRVIKTDGSKISDSDAVLRYIGYYINSAVLMLGWIWALASENNQGWHDMIANTYVVKVPQGREVVTDARKRKNDEVQV
jgi:uncharacterized RDD family membrane protein YckC